MGQSEVRGCIIHLNHRPSKQFEHHVSVNTERSCDQGDSRPAKLGCLLTTLLKFSQRWTCLVSGMLGTVGAHGGDGKNIISFAGNIRITCFSLFIKAL